MDTRTMVLYPFLLGVASHLGWFMHGEHHKLTLRYFQALLGLPPLALMLLIFRAWPFSTALMSTFRFTNAYLTGLYGSPPLAKYSELWHVWTATQRTRNFEDIDDLHAKYGDFVRIGPSELSVIHPDSMELVHGPNSKCTKAEWYDNSPGLTSLHQTRSKKLHDRRRRTWARGFSAQALRNYEPRVDVYTDSLVKQVEAHSGQPLDVSRWFNYYSFDVMGDLAYGKSFSMLETGKSHWAIDVLNGGVAHVGTIGQSTWLTRLFAQMPIITRDFQRFLVFCEDMINERAKQEKELPDIATWILQSPKMENSGYSEQGWLTGDSRLIIVAGSDTTASTLTYLFYHLAEDPERVKKLRHEVDALDGDFSSIALEKLEYLNGLINETLRLHPPVPSGVPRKTPPEGMQIGSTFVPGGVTVKIPYYTIQRDNRNFEHALEFIPERWCDTSIKDQNHSAYAPFSRGPYSCIGKQLALMEIRAVTARMMSKLDVSFGPGEDGSNLVNETHDCFTLHLAPLNLKFEDRK
ncbi:hypothetical protein PV10_04027 [Exophiala mesophila]|uniref:Uncharacterized protein n=1 Tax=Exophiala mesophila TaxID=212818 RepID=A0A0D2A103_EXOME|nr:uncharacterized protein PV10_04027 [Exophiala mesophila]KIV92758.1 hypothetical protein PV10_04027 [Exophiala mesophila]